MWLLHTHKELGAEQEASQEAIAAIGQKMTVAQTKVVRCDEVLDIF